MEVGRVAVLVEESVVGVGVDCLRVEEDEIVIDGLIHVNIPKKKSILSEEEKKKEKQRRHAAKRERGLK